MRNYRPFWGDYYINNTVATGKLHAQTDTMVLIYHRIKFPAISGGYFPEKINCGHGRSGQFAENRKKVQKRLSREAPVSGAVWDAPEIPGFQYVIVLSSRSEIVIYIFIPVPLK